MNCQECNFQNDEGAKYCTNCGIELQVFTTTQKRKKVPPKWEVPLRIFTGSILLGFFVILKKLFS